MREEKQKKVKKHRSRYFDFSLLAMIIFLIFIGLIMIYSASTYAAIEKFGEADYFLIKQLQAISVGLVAMLLTTFFPLKWIEKLSEIIYVLAFLSLFLVRTKLGQESHNATRWFRIPGIPFNIQPAEIVKIAVIIFTAHLFVRMGRNVDTLKGAAIVISFAAVPALVIYTVTDNLSSAIIVMVISFGMLFVANSKYLWAIVLGALGAGAYFGTKTYFTYFDINASKSFRLERIAAWVDPSSQVSDVAFQTIQGLYAIGSGGLWGKGYGASIQKQSFIPEAQNDMIFTIICEELGIVVGIAIILLYAIVLWRIQRIASAASDAFSAYLASGVMVHIGIQVVLNIAVVTNLIPNTGVTLPFISYGGSSIVFLMAEIGLVFNVSRGIVFREDEQ